MSFRRESLRPQTGALGELMFFLGAVAAALLAAASVLWPPAKRERQGGDGAS